MFYIFRQLQALLLFNSQIFKFLIREICPVPSKHVAKYLTLWGKILRAILIKQH